MESACIFLLLLLGWSAAIPQDMFGRMFTFPQVSFTAHVKLIVPRERLEAVSVCVRTFTDLSKSHTLFSMVSRTNATQFVMLRGSVVGEFEVHVKDNAVIFQGQQYRENKWQSICNTWNNTSGLAQLWIDARGSSRKYATTANLTGPFTISLGQQHFKKHFVSGECFVGMMTDLHMWDYVLSPEKISAYSQRTNFPTGNLLDWRSLDFQIIDRVLDEEEQRLLRNV